jgi:hypothetical protein
MADGSMSSIFLFVLDQLTVEFVCQGIYRCVHILRRIGDLVKMSLQALELALDVFSQWRGDFHMVTTDIQLHK